MKKISLMFAVAVAALGFSSCSETWDDNPVLNTHEGEEKADFLNQPQMSDQVIMLTTDNQDGTFHLTCSQPDFGYAAVATYRVQCSLTEDFAKFEEIQQDFYDCGEINPLNADVAAALEKLSGVQTSPSLTRDFTCVFALTSALKRRTLSSFPTWFPSRVFPPTISQSGYPAFP